METCNPSAHQKQIKGEESFLPKCFLFPEPPSRTVPQPNQEPSNKQMSQTTVQVQPFTPSAAQSCKTVVEGGLQQNLQPNSLPKYVVKNPQVRIKQYKHFQPQDQDRNVQGASKSKKSIQAVLSKVSTEKNTEESEEEQYDANCNPGPGEYNLDLPSKASFRSRKDHINKIFFSKCNRFEPTTKLPYSQPSTNNEGTDETSAVHSKGFFLSKLPKFYSLSKDTTPPPGYYNTRQTLQYQLIRGLLKSSNTNSFINSQTRTLEIINKDFPGPGTYHSCILQKSQSSSTSAFKSCIPRNPHVLNISSQICSSEASCPYINSKAETSIIHVKQDSVLETSYFQSPPFLSSSERFPLISKVQKKAKFYEKQQIPKKVEAKRAAFNSSQQRQLGLRGGEGVGVGLYSVFDKQNSQVV